MKLVVYARVSTLTQERTGHSLEAQERQGREVARRHGHEVVAVHSDAKSGRKFQTRTGIQAALASLRRGDADGLWVYSLSRLTRSVSSWSRLVDGYFASGARELRKGDPRKPQGCALMEGDRLLDLNDATAWTMATFSVVMAEAEVRRGSERAAWSARARATSLRGQMPYFKRLALSRRELEDLCLERAAARTPIDVLHHIRKPDEKTRREADAFLERADREWSDLTLRRVAVALGIELELVDCDGQWKAFDIIAAGRNASPQVKYTKLADDLNAKKLPNIAGKPWTARMASRYYERGLEERRVLNAGHTGSSNT